jgi:hypothetical protein
VLELDSPVADADADSTVAISSSTAATVTTAIFLLVAAILIRRWLTTGFFCLALQVPKGRKPPHHSNASSLLYVCAAATELIDLCWLGQSVRGVTIKLNMCEL